MSAPTYDLITEFGVSTDVKALSVSPAWVIAVVRLSLPISFSRSAMASVPGLMAGDGARTRGETLVISNDALHVHVSSSKDSHLGTLQAVLKGTRNYLVDILPDDWMLCWMLNSQESADDLIDRIKKGEACNNFDDGLKFVGRVDSCQKSMTIDPGSGRRLSTYSLSGYSFKELDTQTFYDHNLAEFAQQEVGTWLAKIGLDIRTVFSQTDGTIDDNVHKLIPELFEILLGRGLKLSQISPGAAFGLTAITGLDVNDMIDDMASKQAPFAYLVPEEVGKLLGRTSRSKQGGILAYADLMELVFGVQNYANLTADAQPHRLFTPHISEEGSKGNHRYTGTPMLGAFIPLMPSFSNTPVWSVLEQFLNRPVNEMYTALRVNESGSVVPTLTLRQIPFTTDAFSAKVPVTRFLNLPRWKMHPVMLTGLNIGRSNATRMNFVHIYGQNADHAGIPMVRQLVENHPIRDDIDIQRSGLHPYITTVACDTINQVGKTPSDWMGLVADRVMGSHLTLNGAMQSVGISAPIPPGDNLECEGVVYHIEAVDHICSVSAGGQRSFRTMLRLSYGISDGHTPGHDVNPSTAKNLDFSIYAGVSQSDLTADDPGYGGVNFDPPTVETSERSGASVDASAGVGDVVPDNNSGVG